MSREPLRRAFIPPYRTYFWRARLASLAAYLPAAIIVALTAGFIAANASWFVILLSAWLGCSAGVFAQLVGAQLYVAAEQQAQRAIYA